MSWRRRFGAGRVAIAILMAAGFLLLRVENSRALEFFVTTIDDSGPGSLRQAIIDANANPGSDTIVFRIESLTEPDLTATIFLASPLPPVSDPVTFDAVSSSNYGVLGRPAIEVRGPLGLDSSDELVPTIEGLVFGGGSSGSSVQGLSMTNFTSAIVFDSSNNLLQRSWIGLGVDGFERHNVTGVRIGGRVNTVGRSATDTSGGRGNVIAYNVDGIAISGSSNVVAGNRIGLDHNGEPAGNTQAGVYMGVTAGANVIGGTDPLDRNVISNNTDGVYADSTTVSNTILGNFIGTTIDGAHRAGNIVGIELDNSAATIGGAAPGAMNVISGNFDVGVSILNSDGTVVQGNRIGPDATGATALGNGNGGIVINGGADYIVTGNQISGNGFFGEGMFFGADGVSVFDARQVRIQANLIGTTADGNALLGNGTGIILNDTSDVVVGGTAPGAGNVVSGNQFTGILITCIEIPADLTTLQGNRIGTNAAGTAAVPNGSRGLTVDCATNTLVGGAVPGAANIVSGNLGPGIYDAGTDDSIQGNRIGVGANGEALGNGGAGVAIASIEPEVGGSSPAEGNIIAFNTGDGVSVVFFFNGNPIRFNSIHDNGEMGIDLEDDGPTPNDPGDGDSGANDLQNFPQVDTASATGGIVTASGVLDSLPGTYFVDIYGNSTADGEGETYLGTTTVTVGSVPQPFTVTATFPLATGQRFVTATATATAPQPRNTSEFSPAILATSPVGLTTQASPSVAVGGQIFDRATLSGDVQPGTIVFYLYGPSDATCALTPTISSVPVVPGQLVYDSPPFATSRAGTYRWVAEYSVGEAILVRTPCADPAEMVIVTPAATTLITQASPGVTLGGSVTDTATLGNGLNPTGFVTFNLYGPNDATCATSPAFTSQRVVAGNGPVTSDPFTPSAAGDYRWVAAYSGDANNAPVTGVCNAPNESVTVGSSPTTTTSSTTSTSTSLPPTTTTSISTTSTSTSVPPTSTTSTSTPTTSTSTSSTSTSSTSTSSTSTSSPSTSSTSTSTSLTTTSTTSTTSTSTTSTTVPPTSTTSTSTTSTSTTSTSTTSTTRPTTTSSSTPTSVPPLTTTTTRAPATTTTRPPTTTTSSTLPPTTTTTVRPTTTTRPPTTTTAAPPTTTPPPVDEPFVPPAGTTTTTFTTFTTLPVTTLPPLPTVVSSTRVPTTLPPRTTTTPPATVPPAPLPLGPSSLDARNPAGQPSGPPGVGLDVSGGGYADCGTVYFFFDGVRIGSDTPDRAGFVGVGNLSVPGDANPGQHRVTSACQESGGAVRASTNFQVTPATVHRSAIATSLAQPGQVSLDLQTLATSAVVAIAFLLLFAFPFELFNSTVEENYDEIRGWFRLPARVVGDGSRFDRVTTFFGLTLVTAVVVGFLSPDFGVNVNSLVLVLGFSVALLVMSLGFSLPADIGIHRRTGEWGKLNFLPGTVLISIVMVALSRAFHFQPGYMYGALAGLAFAGALSRADQGRLTAANWAWALVLSVGAWFLRIPVSEAAARPGASVWWIGIEACLVLIFLWGVEGLVVAMLPMRFLDGRKVIDWNRPVWAVLMFLGVFATVHVLLSPTSGYVGHTTGEVTVGVVVLFVLFGAISVGTWAYFRYRPEHWAPRRAR